MSASQKTTNYELGIYVGTDVTDWLGTFNGNMNKIDSQMKVNSNAAATAVQEAGNAKTIAQNANNEVETLTSDVEKNTTDIVNIKEKNSQQDTAISNAQTTANNAASTAQNNSNSISGIVTWKKANGTNLISSATSDSFISFAWNTSLKIATIYGYILQSSPDRVITQGSILCNLPTNFLSDLNIVEDRLLRGTIGITYGTGSGSVIGLGSAKINVSANNLTLNAYTLSAGSGSGNLYVYSFSQMTYFG